MKQNKTQDGGGIDDDGVVGARKNRFQPLPCGDVVAQLLISLRKDGQVRVDRYGDTRELVKFFR